MAIRLDDLRPVLGTLVEGREDAADIIEQVTGLDVPDDAEDRINEAVSEAVAAANAEWNARFARQFLNPEPANPTATNPEPAVVEEETATLSFDDLV